MRVTMLGSHLCPDTFAAMQALLAAKVEICYKDILSCHEDLRTYLKLRDTSEAYAHIRGTDSFGIPCFILEDGTLTLNLAEVLNKA